MAYCCSYKCCDVIFDVFDSERVLLGVTKNKYYVTPSLMDRIDAWMIENMIIMITKQEDMEELISRGLVAQYKQ
jgi:hypothetical protein